MCRSDVLNIMLSLSAKKQADDNFLQSDDHTTNQQSFFKPDVSQDHLFTRTVFQDEYSTYPPAFQTEGHLQNQPSYMIESNQPVYKAEDHNQKYFHGDRELGQTMHSVDSSTMYAQHVDGKLSMAASNEHQFKRELLDRQINQQHEVNYHAYFT